MSSNKKKQVSNMNFLRKFVYQVVVWKNMRQKKHPSISTQDDSCSDCLYSDLVSTAKTKVEPLILKGFYENSVC